MRQDLHPWTLAVVALAQEQKHHISPCPHCRGPAIHSKIKALVRCMRCGFQQIGVKIPTKHKLSCDRCKKKFICYGWKKQYCKKCSAILKERAKDKGKVAEALQRAEKDQ